MLPVATPLTAPASSYKTCRCKAGKDFDAERFGLLAEPSN
jgi:hypothetical protein